MKTSKNDLHESGRVLTKEEFINKIKTDDEFAKKWGDLGPIYGKHWRDWNDNGMEGDYLKGIDQIANLITNLKTNPDDRALIVSAWNVGELDKMVLRPCHNFFQCYTRELSLEGRRELAGKKFISDGISEEWKDILQLTSKHSTYDKYNIPKRALSLQFNMRSTDAGLGLPFNLASYGILLELLAKERNMIADELIYNGGDVHIYENQIEGITEQLNRTSFELPTLDLSNVKFPLLENIDSGNTTPSDFILKNYQSHPAIKMPLSN